MLKHIKHQSDIELRKACNDLIIALEENPHALDHVSYTEKPYRPQFQERKTIRHISIYGLVVTILAKMGVIWYH